MQSSFSLQGMDEVKRKLDQLANPKVANRIARKAIRQGASLVVKSARENAKRFDDPQTSESIAKNITVRASRDRGGVIRMRIGVRGGAKQHVNTVRNIREGKTGYYKTLGSKDNPGGDTWYFRFLEFGTATSPAKPFLRPALTSNTENVINRFAQVFQDELNKELARL